jgi:hypothetical protein
VGSDRQGFYQFLALPPGVYDLRLSRVGLQSMELKGVVVELGRTTAVPSLTVAVQPITLEPVVLQTPRVTLDPAHTAAGGTLRASECADLPVDRDCKSLKVDELHYSTLDENGNPGEANPAYRQPTAYQPPMAVRLGMQVDF